MSWRLRYLYIGTSQVQKDVDYYTKVLGAKKIWDISSFGTRVAALRHRHYAQDFPASATRTEGVTT
jgi:hypothetical protein